MIQNKNISFDLSGIYDLHDFTNLFFFIPFLTKNVLLSSTLEEQWKTSFWRRIWIVLEDDDDGEDSDKNYNIRNDFPSPKITKTSIS